MTILIERNSTGTYATSSTPQITLRLPFPLSVNDLWLNRKKGVGRGRIPTSAYKQWKQDAGFMLNVQRPPKLEGRHRISIQIDQRRQGDADNRIKCVLDLLVLHKIIPGDQKKYVKGVSIDWEAVDECIVTLTKVADYANA